jgi:hypothetical protein
MAPAVPRVRHGLGIVPLVLVALPALVWAQVVPNGGEFRANTHTTSSQSGPAVTADAAGNFVIVWESFAQDGDGDGVFAQRFATSGAAVGAEFRVNSFTTSHQRYVGAAAAGDGDFVVVWTSFADQDGSLAGVFGQRYSSTGASLGGEFRVNSFTTSDQRFPAVAADAAGNFLVAWESSGQDGSGSGVFAQRYGSTGAAAGGEFRVNSYLTSDQRAPSVAATAAGNFVVVWESSGQEGNGTLGIFGQRYDGNGTPLGGEFQVNSYTAADQRSPVVAADPQGGFVVVWESDGEDGSTFGVFGQRFANTGSPLGSEFRVNTYTTADQLDPSVDIDPAGNFLVAWASSGQDGSGSGVFGQHYAANGSPLGSEIRINTYTTSSQGVPVVAADPTQTFVVAWGSNGQDGSSTAISGQRYVGASVTTTTGSQPTTTSTSLPPLCGNGMVDGEEECDDGSANSDAVPDACRSDCLRPHCGDGVTDGGEECDDGSRLSNTDCCDSNCFARQIGRPCGDNAESDCDGPDGCDGHGHCQPNPEPASTPCRVRGGAGTCDAGDQCDGQSKECPLDGLEAGCGIETGDEARKFFTITCFAQAETVEGGTSTCDAAGFVADAAAGLVAEEPGEPGEQITKDLPKKATKLKLRKGDTLRRRVLKLRLNARGKRLLRDSPTGSLRVALRVKIVHGDGGRELQRIVTLLKARR